MPPERSVQNDRNKYTYETNNTDRQVLRPNLLVDHPHKQDNTNNNHQTIMNRGPYRLSKGVVPVLVGVTVLLVISGQVGAEELEENYVKYGVVGRNVSIGCVSTEDRPIWWTKNGNNITATTNKRINIEKDNRDSPIIISNLTITNVEVSDGGNYTCQIAAGGSAVNKPKRFTLRAVVLPKVIASSPAVIKTKISQTVQLFCTFEAYPLADFVPTIKWTKDGENHHQTGQSSNSATNIDAVLPANQTQIHNIDDKHVNATLNIIDIFKKDNGTYTCSMEGPFANDDDDYFKSHRKTGKAASVLVLDVPQVSLDFVKAVGANKIFANWTINDGNAPVIQYFVQFSKENENTFTYYNHNIDGKNQSYVLDNFDPNSAYKLKITAQNSMGMGPTYTYPQSIRTLDKDPVFIPEIGVKGNTHSTITIGWQAPPQNLLEYIHYYELKVSQSGENSSVIEEAIHPQNSRNLPYMFDNLKTATEYKFKVRACSELTKLCGNWSDIALGTTMDGTSSAPLNLQVECRYFNLSGRTTVSAQWEPPLHRNGKITTYHIVLDGLATFRSEKGSLRNETYGPKVKSVDEKLQKAEYENVPLNTNYTIHVSGVTRSKRPGEFASATCTMPKTTPEIGPILWGKVKTETDNWIMKLFLPRISERFGPICGYRIYLVRMPPSITEVHKHLPPVDELHISTYEEVHSANNTKGGVYIAEILPYDDYQPEVILGDGHSIRNGFEDDNDLTRNVQNVECKKLLRGYYAEHVKPPVKDDLLEGSADSEIISPIAPNSTHQENLSVTGNAAMEASTASNKTVRKRRSRPKRQHSTNSIQIEQFENGKTTTTVGPDNLEKGDGNGIGTHVLDERHFKVSDGALDPLSNYTGFVEVIVNIDDERQTLSAYSEYFDVMSGGALNDAGSEQHLSKILNVVTQVLCGLILLVLVLLTALCILHKFHTGKQQGTDVISLRDSLSRALCGGRGGQNHRHLIGTMHTKPADIGPISKNDLSQAYVQRHKDTDYGFLREYEMLPTRFNDRTTKNSDIKENSNKNRYPDIKAYDQTRVRLSERTTNGFTSGSDYINANFVLGYKERKKFICAQGPMDSTINDFWRMIWEQHLELIVMLTNLEEYNKAKCAKYWPEQVNDVTKFGEITVTFTREQRFSDYLVREIKITRRNSGQANNSNVNHNNSTNATSSAGSEDEEERRITQYHYLAWKDFMAPELGVIKFIRLINDVYSVQRGPILVHCSAGVGRTGTLVALDSLMQQLNDENQVSIFNTVCDLRHQRNFLVQSLKQYIFLYRALLDVAQFGNTEIHFKDINATVEQLKARPSDGSPCKLELEFEKIKGVLDETNKNATAGNLEEHRSKNRSDDVIPFDRNRVILTPIGRENTTYINATFIEGYDNTESFIITQDPLEETINDFWRMISEQGITTIVMISEIGEGPRKCPRYWADDEVQYEHILVKYMQSESCPYYTRREFNVTNFKMKDTIKVTQFQYNGWPTVEGEVPEVARGMIELVDQAQSFHNSQSFAEAGPIVVHCSLGTDRSSIFVTLSILVQQLRTEKKIDCCTIVRKLRTQRSLFMSSYAQYEFVHRAIANYADLHKLDLDESPTPSVRTNS